MSKGWPPGAGAFDEGPATPHVSRRAFHEGVGRRRSLSDLGLLPSQREVPIGYDPTHYRDEAGGWPPPPPFVDRRATDTTPRRSGIEIQVAPWHSRWDKPHYPRRCVLCWVERIAVGLGFAHFEPDVPDEEPIPTWQEAAAKYWSEWWDPVLDRIRDRPRDPNIS